MHFFVRMAKIGVYSPHVSKETRSILSAIEKLGHDGVWIREDTTQLEIDNNELNLSDEVSAVANRVLFSKSRNPLDLAGRGLILQERSQCVLNPIVNSIRATYKPATYVTLSQADVPVPDTSFGGNVSGHSALFDTTAVKKPTVGTHGDHSELVSMEEEYSPRIGQTLAVFQKQLQREVEQAEDLRVYVVDGAVLGAMKRKAISGDWRTNAARGSTVEEVSPVPDTVGKIALESVTALGLDYAGVDIMKNDGKWYVLEVNPTAGFTAFFSATGRSPAPHIAASCIERIDESVDGHDIKEYVTEFPDFSGVDIELNATDKKQLSASASVSVSGQNGARKVDSVNFKPTSGPTVISFELATEINAGPIVDTAVRRPTPIHRKRTYPVVPVTLQVDEDTHKVQAAVTKLSKHDVVVKNDILTDYLLVEDSQSLKLKD